MNTCESQFRDATPADADSIVALVQSAYRGDSSRQGWTTEADLLDGQRIDRRSLLELIARDSARVLLLQRDGLLQACCELQAADGHAYFGMFSVRPDGRAGYRQ